MHLRLVENTASRSVANFCDRLHYYGLVFGSEHMPNNSESLLVLTLVSKLRARCSNESAAITDPSTRSASMLCRRQSSSQRDLRSRATITTTGRPSWSKMRMARLHYIRTQAEARMSLTRHDQIPHILEDLDQFHPIPQEVVSVASTSYTKQRSDYL